MQVEIGIDIIVTHMDEVVLVKWGFPPFTWAFGTTCPRICMEDLGCSMNMYVMKCVWL